MRIERPPLGEHEVRRNCRRCHCEFVYDVEKDTEWKPVWDDYEVLVVQCPGCHKYYALDRVRSKVKEK